ncbi:MAG TPA: CHAT domain-containing protein, partial [Thermoanaerobaculia bacterium]|nr:CHAT domain-containing protein [Thermoanaerobaculia bacterium]
GRAVAVVTIACLAACGGGDDEVFERALAERRFEVRLSTTGAWHPCPPAPNQGLALATCAEAVELVEPAPEAGDGKVLRSSAPASREEVEDLHRAGLLALVYGQQDQAVERLEAAAEAAPQDPMVLNDLAAAYYVRAGVKEEALDLLRALGAVERAARLAPDHPAVRFNRALVHDRWHLLRTAEEAWGAYLATDAESEWAAEARNRRAAVPAVSPGRRHNFESVPASLDPTLVRYHVQVHLLGEWAEAVLADPAAAAALLPRLEARATEYEAAAGDPFLSEVVIHLAEVTEEGDPRRLRRLASGVAGFVSGGGDFRQVTAGAAALDRSLADLRRSGSPLALWAELLRLRVDYQAQRFLEVTRGTDRLLGEIDGRPYCALRGRISWVGGIARQGRGDWGGARVEYERSVGAFARCSEWPNELAARNMRHGLLESVGSWREAMNGHHATLTALRPLEDPERRLIVALGLAFAALDLGEHEAALALQDEVVSHAELLGNPAWIANARLKRARIRHESGREGWAADLEAAERAIAEMEDGDAKEITLADLRLEQGRAWREQDPALSLERLSEAKRRREAREARLLWPEVRVELARTQRRLGDEKGAAAGLEAALDELDRHRELVTLSIERAGFSDRVREIYDEMVDLQLAGGKEAEAWRYAAASRGRLLRDWLGGAAGETVAALKVPPPHVLAYTLLPDRLVIWTFTGGEPEATEVALEAGELERLVSAVERAVHDRDGDPGALLERLHELLFAPVAERFAGQESLVVSPDRLLWQVPFAALRPAGGEPLALSHRFLLSPLPTAITPGRPGRRSDRMVAVADPAFSSREYPGLPRLSASLSGIERIRQHYETDVLLSGPTATPEALLAELRRGGVVHVAAHGLVHAEVPLQSALVLAPGGGGRGGGLTGEDLLAAEPSEVPLVVLAACHSMGQGVSASEGPMGLAWPLLTIGVPEVVATLWAVEDEATAELFADFHRQYATGATASEALQRVQRDRIARGEPPSRWAGIVILSAGGGAPTYP